MFTQKDVLRRTLRAFEMWPTQADASARIPQETREVLRSAVAALDGVFLVALLYLSSWLLMMQHGD